MNPIRGYWLPFFAALFSVGALAAPAVVYPEAEWVQAAPASLGWDEAKLKAAADYAFATDQGFVTDSVVIVHGGKLVFERYANGYTPEMRHLGWSTTKSIAVALFGIAEGMGKISRHDPVRKWFGDSLPKTSPWNDVTLAHLASMTSGIQWDESYEAGPLKSNIVAELYHPRYMRDMGGYRLRQNKRVAPVGSRYNYSSGDTNLLMKALQLALGKEVYDAFPWSALFEPIGAKSFTVLQDNAGTFVGSSYSMATPRDYARFGYLFLRGGRWKGKQIVPEDWVKFASTPVPAFSDLRLDHRPMAAYGWGWWLNTPIPTAQIGKAIANAPADAYWAEGHHGQYVFVVPSLDLVMVRLGVDKKGRIDGNRLFGLLMEAYPKKAGAAK